MEITQQDIRRKILEQINENGEGIIDPQKLAVSLGISSTKVYDSIQLLQSQGLIDPPEARKNPPNRIFIGHGHSPAWKELKDFIADRLRLEWDEFDRESGAGLAVTDKLASLLHR